MTTSGERSIVHNWLGRSALDHDVTGVWCRDCKCFFKDRRDICEDIGKHGPSRIKPGVRCLYAILFSMFAELEEPREPIE